MNRSILTFWVLLHSAGCKPTEMFILLPHYQERFKVSAINPNPRIVNYVLVQVPSVKNEAFVQTLFEYGLKISAQVPEQYESEIRFYALSANTTTFRSNLVNPNELADMRLDDESDAFLGVYLNKTCEANPSKSTATFTFKDYFSQTSTTPSGTIHVIYSNCNN